MCPAISVIVPVFNASAYLSECIESVLNQSFENFELIIVDDGSEDNSFDITSYYCKHDCRIKALRQINKGVSAARNYGLTISRGEFITFLDADDTYTPQILEAMYAAIVQNDTEICICDSQAIYKSGVIEIETFDSLTESCSIKKSEITPKILLEAAGAVWRCLYRASLIKSNKICFTEDLKIAEDRIFNIYAIGVSSNLCYLKKCLYNRYIREDSTVHRYHSDYFRIAKFGQKATYRAIKIAWDNDPEFQLAYLKQFIYASICAIENIKHPDSPLSYIERRRSIKKICKDEELTEAIIATDYRSIDVRAKWILEKKYHFLMMKSMQHYWQYRRLRRIFSIDGLRRVICRLKK